MDEDYSHQQHMMQEQMPGGAEENDPSSMMGKDFYDEEMDDDYEDDGNGFNGRSRGRGNFRGRGRNMPPGWMPRPRGRGYGPSGPPMRARGYFRPRNGPRFPPGPNNYDGNWNPMGPPPGMMSGPPPFGPPPGMMAPPGMGPPPNMMGQGPPPFMPNMPPNMLPPELWVETKSDEGKTYYYDARTRETTWTRPQESATLKIVFQSEIEAMVSLQQQLMNMPPNMQPGQNNMQPSGQNNIQPGQNNLPPNMQPPGQNNMPPNMQPPGQNNMPPSMQPPGQNNMTPNMQQPPSNMPLNMQPPNNMPPNMQPPNNMPPNMQPPNNMPPNMQPPTTMAPNMQGQNSLPLNMQGLNSLPLNMQGQSNLPPNMQGQNSLIQNLQPPNTLPPNMPPFLGQQPPNWMTKADDQGPPGIDSNSPTQEDSPMAQAPPFNANLPGSRPPFQPGMPPPGNWWGAPGWNPLIPPQQGATGVLTPTSAASAMQLDSAPGTVELAPTPEIVIPPEVEAAAAEWTTHSAPDGRAYYYHAAKQLSVWEKPQPLKQLQAWRAKIAAANGEPDDEVVEVIDVEAHAEAKAAKLAKEAAEKERKAAEEREKAEKERLEKERIEKEKQEKERLEKERIKQDKSRPLWSTPISGTPWCVVWTGNHRVFFHNPAAHISTWDRPADLIGRVDVDKAVAQPPGAIPDLGKDESTPQAASNVNMSAAPAANTNKSNGELKRNAQPTDSDDSDSEPIKKPKTEQGGQQASLRPPPNSAGGAAAAEARAAKERALVPLETRIARFKDMLRERDVSAFSTWGKELHKIVFDERYLLLASRERKQVFEKYVRERADEERKEKKNKILQIKNTFKELLEESKLHSKSSYAEFANKYSKDERFKAVEKVRDREAYFMEFVTEVRRKEKDEREKRRETAKNDFIAMLREKSIDRHLRWPEAKKKVDTEAKYKAVESSTLREDYYREYCKMMKEEKKKESKDKDRESRGSGKKDKKDKKEKKDKKKDKESKEKDKDKEKSGDEEELTEQTTEPDSTTQPETTPDMDEQKRSRAAREAASLAEREREVQKALASSLRDRDKERQQHQNHEAKQHFTALLADLVRDPELTWREARKQLRKDGRYELAELLSKEDKEKLFVEHTHALGEKRRIKFRNLLDDLKFVHTARWTKVKESLKDDPRTPNYARPDQMEREFREYQRDRQSEAKSSLKQLLQETHCISHKTLSVVQENSVAMNSIIDTLKHDARYTALDHVPEDRHAIIMSYLEDLQKKGPPPPPTASEPSRRPKQ